MICKCQPELFKQRIRFRLHHHHSSMDNSIHSPIITRNHCQHQLVDHPQARTEGAPPPTHPQMAPPAIESDLQPVRFVP